MDLSDVAIRLDHGRDHLCDAVPPVRRMSTTLHPGTIRAAQTEENVPMRNHILFLIAMWLIALLPFLLWRGTWFGRPLSDQQIGDYLHDNTNAKNVQHALT